jgi:hypothetical protein
LCASAEEVRQYKTRINKTEERAQYMKGRAKTLQTTNKASIGRKAALGLRQIAALLAPSESTQSQSLLQAPSCRQCGNFLLFQGCAKPGCQC